MIEYLEKTSLGDFMIRKANKEDIKEIMGIIKDTVKEMKLYNNTQWDENYPNESDFINDINRQELYVDERDEELVGLICLNKVEAPEYKSLEWEINEDALVIHRVAVKSSKRNLGIGSNLMKFAEKISVEQGLRHIKTDTYLLNEKMDYLFKKHGYKTIGQVRFEDKEKPFNCYEKLINIEI